MSAAAEASWWEASARERLAGLLDAASFAEFLPPEARASSPHLACFNLPAAFDDGVVVGHGRLDGRPVLVAAQEGRFMGGTFGEVHGAKLTGLLRAARGGDRPVLLLLDTGGVRLQEANAGEIAVSELIRTIVEARISGVPVMALLGGRAGCFGGGGIIAATCSHIVVSEQGRIGVTGPEVIETNAGVEEFDSRDRPLVWRVTGGRTRALTGGADAYVDGAVGEFREAAIAALVSALPPLSRATLEAEQARLAGRRERLRGCRDATEIWARQGLETMPMADLADADFRHLLAQAERPHDSR
ncbi:biotin-independent malonate decarboxylase subunit beta [Lichenicoccus sp.]|uniref:biotin-independent malonate decarboxylase subunit beta n=1 Tax=Lichenicoccus sp. TaxID=2781899 RepID=UPI003D12D8CD